MPATPSAKARFALSAGMTAVLWKQAGLLRVVRNDSEEAFLHRSIGFRRTLLTGNGLSAALSVKVRWSHIKSP